MVTTEAHGRGSVSLSATHDVVRTLLGAGRADEAIDLLIRLTKAAPQHVRLHHDLVTVLVRADRGEEALSAALQGLAHHPTDTILLDRGARLAAATARWALAVDLGSRLGALTPDDARVWRRLTAAARMMRDQLMQAWAAKEWLRCAPDDPAARHLAAAASGDTPARADGRYVAGLFDAYAGHFDHHLAELGYRAPQLVARRLDEMLAPSAVGTCLDLGCGTGHVGSLIRDRVAHLHGVDLSAAMLAKAAQRGCYDQLTHGDLVDTLAASTDVVDVVLAADVLNYLGDLRPVWTLVHSALRPGGVLVCTLEDGGRLAGGYALHANGRFAHDPSWITATLAAAGFAAVEAHRCVLRTEGASEVHGWLVSGRKVGGGFGDSPDVPE